MAARNRVLLSLILLYNACTFCSQYLVPWSLRCIFLLFSELVVCLLLIIIACADDTPMSMRLIRGFHNTGQLASSRSYCFILLRLYYEYCQDRKITLSFSFATVSQAQAQRVTQKTSSSNAVKVPASSCSKGGVILLRLGQSNTSTSTTTTEYQCYPCKPLRLQLKLTPRTPARRHHASIANPTSLTAVVV